MGRDKGLLPYHGSTLVAHVAARLKEALGPAAGLAIVGHPDRYRELGYPVYADLLADCGPLGGIVTALHVTKSDWNLIVACDMPVLSPDNLKRLAQAATKSPASCIAAGGSAANLEPLCAAYHRRCLPILERALREKRFKMMDLLAELGAQPVLFPPEVLVNVNTPEQWKDFERQPQ